MIPAKYEGWQLLVAHPEAAPKTRTVPELKELLDQHGIEYPSSALKADLITLVEQIE